MKTVDIGSRRELFCDDFIVAQMAGGARYELHRPEAREVTLVTDKPWEGAMGAFMTVIAVADGWRLYYDGIANNPRKGEDIGKAHSPVICLAESKDGIVWQRVMVNRFEWPGATENNIIWQGVGGEAILGVHGFAPFIDTNPECRPGERWKAFGGAWHPESDGLYMMISADGVNWEMSGNRPIFKGHALDSQNTVRWSEVEGCYRIYFRHYRDGMFAGPRTIMTATSPDLVEWSKPMEVEFPGAPIEQLYTNSVGHYFRAPHIWMGFPVRYVEREWSPAIEALPELEERQTRAALSRRYGTALTETVFMASRNGVSFKRWGEAFLRPGLRSTGSWVYGDMFMAWGMAVTESRLSGGGEELSFYGTEGYWRGGGKTIRRYVLRLDGFVSVNAPLAGGSVVTRPLVFSGDHLSMNYSCSAAGSIKVAILDSEGVEIKGYGMGDCWESLGDTIDGTAQWRGGRSVGTLAGRVVRLRFELSDADLYSFKFEEK